MPLNRLVIYAGNVEETARFYEKHFGFKATILPGDRIIELVAQDGGANIMLHQAAKGQRGGQSAVKLVFDVEDVEAFADDARRTAWSSVPFIKPMAISSPMQKTHVKIRSRFPAGRFARGDRGKVARVLPL